MDKFDHPGRLISGEEITAFVLEELPAGRAREIEAMAREDEDLATTILMMRALLVDTCDPSSASLFKAEQPCSEARQPDGTAD